MKYYVLRGSKSTPHLQGIYYGAFFQDNWSLTEQLEAYLWMGQGSEALDFLRKLKPQGGSNFRQALKKHRQRIINYQYFQGQKICSIFPLYPTRQARKNYSFTVGARYLTKLTKISSPVKGNLPLQVAGWHVIKFDSPEELTGTTNCKLVHQPSLQPQTLNRARKYRHLGKAGSIAHVNAVMGVVRTTIVLELEKTIDSLSDSLVDVSFDGEQEDK